MARIKEFDPDDALHRAMLVFWRNGYTNTTMEDLVEGTGVVRASLYATFGNKAELFRRAVERYGEFQASRVSGARGPLDALRTWFDNAIHGARKDRLPSGCLLINTAAEYGTLDRPLQKLVNAHLDLVRAFFRACVRTGAPDLDPETTANVLMGANVSIYLLGCAGAPARQLQDIAAAALAPVLAAGQPAPGR
jgi:TetR/AcrR family transcriptional repressor of nem operon